MKGRKRGKERYTLYIYTRAYGGTKEERGREAGTNTINKDTEEIERFTENGEVCFYAFTIARLPSITPHSKKAPRNANI